MLLTGPQHDVVADRQALGGQQLLGELLVHARRAGQHTRAHVRHAGEFEQALDGAVLAVRAVQHREHHVDGGQQLPAAPCPSDSSSPRAAGSAGSASAVPDVPLTSGSRPSVIARLSGLGVGQHPRALRRDADRDHLEPLRIEVAQDATCGNA